ncbi:uncharacterized protein LOC123552744 isoform X1 [Mercenaria mercenaria]|uniref:uncharacterized protein LOC123552744 isoform X1 n=1 Tax=Mercenaria mercenaria TaxID=6596 RepID=UPI00234F4C6C|nr:uncharacterized protein LOC123552744 isoform X1 [Mercenaria mercenaria]
MDQFKLRTLTFGFLFVCSFCAVTSQVDVCSSSFPGGALCNCTKTPSSLTYDCRARKIGYVPRGYKSTATTLNLSNNKIYNVYIGPLNNLRKLSILYLQANLIYQIEPGSFNGLMKLTQLILTSNQLTAIERGVFSHLPALEVLDLSNNKIKTINRYAFITLPSVYLINLESNQLTCGCEEYLLHEFFEIRKSSLTVQNKPCSTSTLQQPASTICTSGETLFVPSTSCYQCSNAVGVRDCRNQTVTNCSGPNSVCYNQMHYYYPGHLSVSGGCIDYTSCLYQEQRNRETCLNGTGTGTTCYFCNPDKLSNSRDETNTTRQFYVTLLVTLNQVMTSQLRDTNSAAYKSFTRNLENEVSNYIRNQKAAYRVNFVDLRSPDVTIAFRVLCATIWYNTKADVMDAIASALSRRTVNGVRVKTVQVFETSNTETCSDVYTSATSPPPSGPYTFANANGETFTVYCLFKSGYGYTFIAADISVDPNLAQLFTEKTEVLIRHKRQNGSQYDATAAQISRYSSKNLGVLYNSHTGYNEMRNGHMTPYLYVGFVPKAGVDHYHDTQGWKVQGTDYTFKNCDGNPNSYFSLLYNSQDKAYRNYSHGKTDLLHVWYDYASAANSRDYIPDAFFTDQFEIHFGGCGGYQTSTSFPDVVGVTIGLRFNINECASNPCKNGAQCTNGQNSFTCSCASGWSGTTCNTAPCPSETTESSTYGQFSWPTTKPGTVAFIQCPYQLSGAQTAKYASRICEKQADNSGLWKTPLLSDCPHADESSRELHNLAESDINNGNVEQVSSSLSNLTSNWEEFVSDDVIWSVRIIDGILKTDLSRASFDTITNTIETVNNLLFITPGILRQSEDESDSSNRLVNAVETLLDGVSVTNGDYKSVKDNIAGIVSGVSVSSFDGLAMSYINKGKQTLTETELAYTKAEGYTASGHSGIILPRSIFDSLTNRQKRSIDKMTMSVFRDPKLFSSITQSNETKLLPSDDGDVIPAERKINSNVIAANVPSVQIKDLSFPVVVTLHHFDAGENVSCVYWDVATKSWSADGCAVNQTTDDYTVCHCDHLTNFALLMDVYSTGGGLSKANSVALSIISYVGCGLSLLGVIITLLTYLKFRKLRRDNPSKILMNLCLSIGFVDIVFLIGVQEYSGKSDAGCKIVAILLHYFLLTAMCWMAVEAFYMYLALVKVFDTYVAHFQLKSALFGWGIPFVVVVVTLGINKTENYGLQPGGICWLDRVPFYAAFLGPVCLLLIVNTITYALVIRMIVKRSNKKLTKTDKSSTAVRLRGAISLVVLLGLTWAFAILAFDDFGIVFHYLFAVLNSLQGFFIFIFYCLMKKEAQQCWRKALPCLKSPYQKNISTNTQSKGDSSTFDSNKTTKMHLNTRDESNEDKKPTGNTGPNNTAFRGNWQVQVTTRSQPSSFV